MAETDKKHILFRISYYSLDLSGPIHLFFHSFIRHSLQYLIRNKVHTIS